jgi:hypothetical protein
MAIAFVHQYLKDAVVLGVASLYLALLVLTLAGAGLKLAWFVSSLAPRV